MLSFFQLDVLDDILNLIQFLRVFLPTLIYQTKIKGDSISFFISTLISYSVHK